MGNIVKVTSKSQWHMPLILAVQRTEAGGLLKPIIQSQPGKHSETLYLKI